MKDFDFFAVTIVVDCPDCNLALPLQNLNAANNCPHCKKTFACDWNKGGRFETALTDQLERAVDYGKALSTDTVLSVTVIKKDVLPCELCESPLVFKPDSMEKLSCSVCKGISLFKSAQPLHGVDYIVSGFNGDQLSKEHFSVSCISCGADIGVKGDSRSVTCDFCSRDTVISDAIWQKLHPELFIKPFYFALSNIDVVQKEAQKTGDAERIGVLALHFYPGVRKSVAQNPSLSENVARQLMKDKNGDVVNALRKHPEFKKWFSVKQIFADKDEAKTMTLEFPNETNPNLSEAEMMTLAKQRMPKRLIALAYNPSITNVVMKQIIRHDIDSVSLALAKRLDLDADILKLLVNTDDMYVQIVVASNSAMAVQSMQRLAGSNNPQVLAELLKNKNLPEDIRRKTKERYNQLV